VSKPNQTAWITGASSGIGRALALKMAAEGWSVAATARSKEALGALIDETAGLPGKITAFPIDIRDAQTVETTFTAIECWLGRVNLAVLNAGTYKPDDSATLTRDDVTAMIDLNLKGTMNCLHVAAASMKENGRGHIAVVASVAGYCGLPGATAYGASKAGLINLTESLRPELARSGIKLQLVNPGFVETPLTAKNDFAMPFLMPLEDAVAALYRGLMSNRFEIVFPWRFAMMMKLLSVLPYGLYFRLTRRLLRD
jgi:short-subunit dehydrogenase